MRMPQALTYSTAYFAKGLLPREEQLGDDVGRRWLRQDVQEQRQQLRDRHAGLLPSCVTPLEGGIRLQLYRGHY